MTFRSRSLQKPPFDLWPAPLPPLDLICGEPVARTKINREQLQEEKHELALTKFGRRSDPPYDTVDMSQS
jgi:hypothetical protein